MQQMRDKSDGWVGQYTKNKIIHLISGYSREIQREFAGINIPQDIVMYFTNFYFCDLKVIWTEIYDSELPVK